MLMEEKGMEEKERIGEHLCRCAIFPVATILMVKPNLSLERVWVSNIPHKHARSLQRRVSLAFGFGTFAYAKDQASLPLDGLHME